MFERGCNFDKQVYYPIHWTEFALMKKTVQTIFKSVNPLFFYDFFNISKTGTFGQKTQRGNGTLFNA